MFPSCVAIYTCPLGKAVKHVHRRKELGIRLMRRDKIKEEGNRGGNEKKKGGEYQGRHWCDG